MSGLCIDCDRNENKNGDNNLRLTVIIFNISLRFFSLKLKAIIDSWIIFIVKISLG